MANPQHLAEQKRGAHYWNEWRKNNSEIIPDLSDTDLSNANLNCADLTKTNLTKANLTKAILADAILVEAILAETDLCEAYLSNANLSRANLSGANLSKANLTNTKFINAIMHGADLRGTKTAGMQLGGADVTNAILPDEIKSFEGLKTVEEASKISKRLFTILLSALGFSLLTIFSTKDVPLLTNSSTTPLPLIQASVPLASFYWITPILISGFFLYFLLNLLHLYKLISRLPAIFPDGIPLDEKMYPWLLNTLVREFFPILKKNKVHLFLWRKILIGFLTWWFTPIILFCFWFRYLPRHDFVWSHVHIFCIALVVFLVIDIYFKTIQTLKNNPNHLRPLKYYFCQLLGMALSLVLLINITHYAIEEVIIPDRQLPFNYQSVGRYYLNLWLSINITDQDVSHKPDNWSKEKPTEGVKGALLEGVNMDYAIASGAFLVKAKLSHASLKHAYLMNANLMEANLTGANLTDAYLARAKLRGANLTGVNLTRAKLRGAKLRGADLREADLAGAIFFGSRNTDSEQIMLAKNWELAFYDDVFRKQLPLSFLQTKKAICAYLAKENTKLSEKDLGDLYKQQVKEYKKYYGDGFVTAGDKPCKRDETPAPAAKGQ